jgi:hypothetical protein
MTGTPFLWPGRRLDDPAHEMLAAFLVMDIQRNPEWAREVAERIAEVKSGTLPEWERIGNAFRLEISSKGVSIEDLVDEDSPVHEIPLEDFSKALKAWIEACG